MTHVLVAIANHGHGNRGYLDALTAEYRRMRHSVRVCILSNIPKDLGDDVEVLVGVPTDNPWSLPFAHRPLFAQRQGDYDVFIYSEDDTLVSERAIRAFVQAAAELESNEIAGFVRTETGPDGTVYYSTMHSHYHWDPASVCRRGGRLYAAYTNDHAAAFMLTRDHLRHCIDSGGFLVEPHEGRHDMLCSAATDPYTRCGLRRLVCIDAIADFTLPHLPNKYIGKMGLAKADLEVQIEALRRIERGELPADELMQTATRLPRERYSKSYHERPDGGFPREMLAGARNVLSVGCGLGELERPLVGAGARVVGVPLDAVIGENARSRGVEIRHTRLSELETSLAGEQFDGVVLSNILHLAPDPSDVVRQVLAVTAPGAKVAVRIPNFGGLSVLRRRLKGEPGYRHLSFESNGVHPFTQRTLCRLLRAAGLRVVRIDECVQGRSERAPKLVRRALRSLLNSEIRVLCERR